MNIYITSSTSSRLSTQREKKRERDREIERKQKKLCFHHVIHLFCTTNEQRQQQQQNSVSCIILYPLIYALRIHKSTHT